MSNGLAYYLTAGLLVCLGYFFQAGSWANFIEDLAERDPDSSLLGRDFLALGFVLLTVLLWPLALLLSLGSKK